MHLIAVWWHFSDPLPTVAIKIYAKIHPVPEKVKMTSFCYFIPHTSPDGI